MFSKGHPLISELDCNKINQNYCTSWSTQDCQIFSFVWQYIWRTVIYACVGSFDLRSRESGKRTPGMRAVLAQKPPQITVSRNAHSFMITWMDCIFASVAILQNLGLIPWDPVASELYWPHPRNTQLRHHASLPSYGRFCRSGSARARNLYGLGLVLGMAVELRKIRIVFKVPANGGSNDHWPRRNVKGEHVVFHGAMSLSKMRVCKHRRNTTCWWMSRNGYVFFWV